LCLDRARVDASYDGLDKTEEYDGMYVSGDDAATGPWHPLDLPLVIINVCVITVGLVANCVVFFVIFAGRETSKSVSSPLLKTKFDVNQRNSGDTKTFV